MAVSQIATATKILNQVAAETGTEPVTDPYASTDPTFVQMRYLLNVAGDELVTMYPWENLVHEHAINTLDGDSGDYPLPSDFCYMMDQTGWDRTNRVPLFGPQSPQDWQYLLGRQLASSTIYASFRINEGLFKIFPQPPPVGLDIHFEYMSCNWVSNGEFPPTYNNEVTAGTDTPLFDRTLISRYLKVKMLSAKGFDSSKAQDDFNQVFANMTGQDKGAPLLNAGGWSRGFPYLDTYRNLPDTGYGNP